MVGLVLLAGSCVAVGLSWAADPKTDQVDEMAAIGQAMKLIELGRQADSPEALIGAAKILAKCQFTEMKDVKPIEEDKVDTKKAPKPGPAIQPPKDVKPSNFTKQIGELLQEAKEMAKDHKDDKLLAYIDTVPKEGKKLDTTEGQRASVGGPKTLNEGLDVGKSKTYTFTWKANEQARVVSTSDRNVLVQVHRTRDQFLEGAFQGKSVELFWTPTKQEDFTVRITNTTGAPVKYSLFVN
jgi:hypothetical protein